MNEWMKWSLIYRLSSGQWPDLKAVHSTYHILNWWAAYLGRTEQGHMFMVNFLFSHHHLFGLNYIFSFFVIHILIFLCPHIFIFIFTVHAGCLYVTDTLSTPTITEPPSVECQDLLIPCQIECMYCQNRPRFIVPSERLSNEVQVPCVMTNRNSVFCFHYLCFHS